MSTTSGRFYPPKRWAVARALLRSPTITLGIFFLIAICVFVSDLGSNGTTGAENHKSVAASIALGVFFVIVMMWRFAGVSVSVDDRNGILSVRNFWRSYRIRFVDIEEVSTGVIALEESKYSVKREPALMIDRKSWNAKKQKPVLVQAALRNGQDSRLLDDIRSLCEAKGIPYRFSSVQL